MIRISHLKLRNFKSFKNLNIELPPGVVCFAGPNGAGKSNITDAISFVLGESSLKSLRAKKVKDLIHIESRTAEVWLRFDGDEKYEIKRAIRDDGKIIYRLNGKRTTRTSVLEVLKKYNLDISGRNIIAQGEVQRIGNMNGKERRQIIDAVAGITDFEDKKKEALSELALVEGRINEANIIVGERMAFLNELAKERDIAIRYKEAKEKLDGARGALVKIELEKSKKELEKYESQRNELEEKKKKIQEETDKNRSEIERITNEKAELTGELQKKQKSSEEIRKMEELKARIAATDEKVREKNELLARFRKESGEIDAQIKKEANELENLKEEIGKLEKELKEWEKKSGSQNIRYSSAIEELKRKKNEIEKELSELKEKNANLTAEKKATMARLEMTRKQLAEFNADTEETKANEQIEKMRAEKTNIEETLEELFQQTKEANKRIGEIEKEMLELKEKISIYRVRASPQLMNPALRLIEELKQKENGIYGTVADLIQFDASLSRAVEAAGGGRLLYVVVDKADRAIKIIERLKKERIGRVTFIPLDSIRSNEPKSIAGFESIITKIKFNPEVRKAMEYVFGDTVLIKSHEDAKAIGIGKCRMVTTDGEIYEIAGTIAGGFVESGILAQNQLKKLEDAFATAKKEKEELTARLYSIREEEAELRARKSRIETEIKMLENEAKQRMEEEAQTRNKREQLQREAEEMEKKTREYESQIASIEKRIAELSEKSIAIIANLEKAEKEEAEKNEEANRKAKEIVEKVSGLRATIEGKKKEQQMISESFEQKNARAKEIREEIEKLEKEIKESIAEAEKSTKQLREEEEKMRTKGKQIEELFERIREYEQKLQALGEKNEILRRDMAAVEKELAQLEVKKATTKTRLGDLETEIQKYANVKIFENETKQKLSEMVEEAERVLNEIGANVNLAAIEAYAKKEAEISEVKKKIDQLNEERNAIMKMMDEIEERKKEVFFEAFNKINDNFKKMFSYVNIGQGYLLLDKPNEPFESGLYIKIRHGNHEYPLDSLSGGEITLISLMFIFALQFFKPAPFYVLDEIDAALDKENSKRMVELIKQMSKDSQFIVVSHNDTVIANSDVVYGVTKSGNASKVVAVKLEGIEMGKETAESGVNKIVS